MVLVSVLVQGNQQESQLIPKARLQGVVQHVHENIAKAQHACELVYLLNELTNAAQKSRARLQVVSTGSIRTQRLCIQGQPGGLSQPVSLLPSPLHHLVPQLLYRMLATM